MFPDDVPPPAAGPGPAGRTGTAAAPRRAWAASPTQGRGGAAAFGKFGRPLGVFGPQDGRVLLERTRRRPGTGLGACFAGRRAQYRHLVFGRGLRLRREKPRQYIRHFVGF